MLRISSIIAFLLLTGCVMQKERGVPKPAPDTPTQKRVRVEHGDTTAKNVRQTGTGALPDRLLLDGTLEIGNRESPLSLLLVTNHACRYCREFQEASLLELTEEFIRPGVLRLGIEILPLKKYPQSRFAASALYCASAQGKGLALHEVLFENSADRRLVSAEVERIGVDAKAFELCLEDPFTGRMLDAQESSLRTLSVELIPTFFLNGERRTGLMEYPELRGWIEKTIAELE